MADGFKASNGAGSFDAWLQDYADVVQVRWSELLVKTAIEFKINNYLGFVMK